MRDLHPRDEDGKRYIQRVFHLNGIPRRWIQKIRRAMVTLVPQFNTWRMVQEYTRKYYVGGGDE